MESLAPLSRKNKALLLAGVGLLVLCVVSAISGSWGWLHLRRLEKNQAEMEALAMRLERQNEAIREHLERLESDNAYLEKVVRERLGWVKPNELVYRVDGSVSTRPGDGEAAAPADGED
jgi:cell division protein FtsB